jgi:hypothetical protein
MAVGGSENKDLMVAFITVVRIGAAVDEDEVDGKGFDEVEECPSEEECPSIGGLTIGDGKGLSFKPDVGSTLLVAIM